MQIDWTDIARFWVSGLPVGQPRPRARAMRQFSAKQKKFVWIAQVYNPDTADGWKDRIEKMSQRYRPDQPLEGPVRVDVTVHLPRPQYMMSRRWPEGPVLCPVKPDRDNLDKVILDAMTCAGWWRDDCQVCAGEVIKVYHAKQGEPGARIEVAALPALQPELFEGSPARAEA